MDFYLKSGNSLKVCLIKSFSTFTILVKLVKFTKKRPSPEQKTKNVPIYYKKTNKKTCVTIEQTTSRSTLKHVAYRSKSLNHTKHMSKKSHCSTNEKQKLKRSKVGPDTRVNT